MQENVLGPWWVGPAAIGGIGLAAFLYGRFGGGEAGPQLTAEEIAQAREHQNIISQVRTSLALQQIRPMLMIAAPALVLGGIYFVSKTGQDA